MSIDVSFSFFGTIFDILKNMKTNIIMEQLELLKEVMSVKQYQGIKILLSQLPNEIVAISQIAYLEMDVEAILSWNGDISTISIIVFEDGDCAISKLGDENSLCFYDTVSDVLKSKFY